MLKHILAAGVPVLVAVLASTGLWSFITARLERRDKTKDTLKEISDKIDSVSRKVDQNSAVLARTHILRFSDEIMNGIEHSQEYWRQTLMDIDTYETFCKDHPEFKNSYCVAAVEYINRTYRKLLDDHEFKMS